MNLFNPFQSKTFAKFQLESGKANKVHTLKNKADKPFFVYQLSLFSKYCIFYTYDYSTALTKLAKKENAIYTLIESYKGIALPQETKFSKSIKSIIPRHTNVIDLAQDEEQIFNKMHPKGRYNIRLATKKNLEIKEIHNAKDFYTILKTTSTRDNFYINSIDYYQQMLDILSKKSYAKLFIAYHQGIPIAGILNTYLKDTCTYYYGASSNSYRNLMAPYLLQWHAIKDAKAQGYKYYDFLGVADPKNPKDPLKGVTYFKQKFGGDYIKWPNSVTLVHNPVIFHLLKIRNFGKKLLDLFKKQ